MQQLERLKSKQHFEILDGLRGIAALSVVLFHFMEIVYFDPNQNFIAHGFLAVDFFFCLSGFVISYAYDERVEGMGIIEFFKSRLIRLHPLVFLGAVLGVLGFLFDPFVSQATAYSAGKIFMMFWATAFLIPYPVIEERFFNNFGLNAPAWSLFWEYVANIVYAFILFRLGKYILLALTAIAAGLLGYVAYTSDSLVGGWNGETFWHGGARIFYSFLAGMVIFRYKLIIKSKLGFVAMSALLFLAFIVPFGKWAWLTQLLTILIYFPLMVSLGAGATLGKMWEKLCVFFGNLSYPLYMTHYFAMWIFLNYIVTKKPALGEITLVILITFPVLVLFAYLVMKYYDIPLRKYLTARRNKK
jgi:peptidoglycan/LPS O-acetylase OafA/YrhL